MDARGLDVAAVGPAGAALELRAPRDCLTASDVDAAYKALKATGVNFTMPPSRQPWGDYMAMFEDPDGNVFYLQPNADWPEQVGA